MRRRTAHKDLLENVAQNNLIERALRGTDETGVAHQVRPADHLADRGPQAVIAGGHGEIFVLRLEGLIWRVARMRGAELLRILARTEVLAGLQRRDSQRRSEHRDVDMFATATDRQAPQRCRDRKGRVKAGREIGHRNSALHRAAIGLSGHAHDACNSLDRQIEAAFARARSRLPVSGNGTVDERRLLLHEAFVAEPVLGHHARSIILDDDIRRKRQLTRALAVARVLQVQRDRLLVAVHRCEVLAEALTQRRPDAHGIARALLFDLDDLRAHVGQKHAAKGAGRHLAKLDNPDSFERQHGIDLFLQPASCRLPRQYLKRCSKL